MSKAKWSELALSDRINQGPCCDFNLLLYDITISSKQLLSRGVESVYVPVGSVNWRTYMSWTNNQAGKDQIISKSRINIPSTARLRQARLEPTVESSSVSNRLERCATPVLRLNVVTVSNSRQKHPTARPDFSCTYGSVDKLKEKYGNVSHIKYSTPPCQAGLEASRRLLIESSSSYMSFWTRVLELMSDSLTDLITITSLVSDYRRISGCSEEQEVRGQIFESF